MPKVDVESEIEGAEKRVNALERKTKQLVSAQKKKYAEFETLNGALYEGKDLIEDNKKQLKREKNDRKRKALTDEIEESERTFGKISKKLEPIVKALKQSGDASDAISGELKTERKTLVDLGNSLKRTGGELDQLRQWAAEIKKLIKTVADTAETAGQAADLPNTLPNTPRL